MMQPVQTLDGQIYILQRTRLLIKIKPEQTLLDLKKRTAELIKVIDLDGIRDEVLQNKAELNQLDVGSNPNRFEELNQKQAVCRTLIKSIDAIK